jgi:hypothetical protein
MEAAIKVVVEADAGVPPFALPAAAAHTTQPPAPTAATASAGNPEIVNAFSRREVAEYKLAALEASFEAVACMISK